MKVGVIGAGTMGQGIAKAFAQTEGFTVALCDIKQEWADKGKDKIAAGYAKLVAKGKLDQAEVDRRMAAITAGLKEDLCADCDILIPMINEAAFIKMEGVSDIAGIDTAMKLGANHPMGPLELGDFIGLDICLAIMDVLYKETGDSKYRACPLIRKMVRGGNLGCKTGKGFYVYNADRTKTAVDAL